MSDAPLPRCPWCSEIVNDDDTVQCTMDGVTWHARCKDMHDTKRRRERMMKPQIGDVDPATWARMSEAAGATPVFFERTNDPRPIQFQPTIDYTITPKRFILDIPVEALASLTPDAHTRMLAMLNNWVTENKPDDPQPPQSENQASPAPAESPLLDSEPLTEK